METVKYIAEIETPEVLTGYLVDGTKTVPIDDGNRDYIEVQAWIAEGNTPELPFSFEELQSYKMTELTNDIPPKPRVFVRLEDGITEIYIWGSREDQVDIGDRYELMKEDSVANIYLKDTDEVMHYLYHVDIKRCYKAITLHRQNVIEYQWLKESEIMACTTQAELDLITWDIP